jgi:hypothetical protein
VYTCGHTNDCAYDTKPTAFQIISYFVVDFFRVLGPMSFLDYPPAEMVARSSSLSSMSWGISMVVFAVLAPFAI